MDDFLHSIVHFGSGVTSVIVFSGPFGFRKFLLNPTGELAVFF